MTERVAYLRLGSRRRVGGEKRKKKGLGDAALGELDQLDKVGRERGARKGRGWERPSRSSEHTDQRN